MLNVNSQKNEEVYEPVLEGQFLKTGEVFMQHHVHNEFVVIVLGINPIIFVIMTGIVGNCLSAC